MSAKSTLASRSRISSAIAFVCITSAMAANVDATAPSLSCPAPAVADENPATAAVTWLLTTDTIAATAASAGDKLVAKGFSVSKLKPVGIARTSATSSEVKPSSTIRVDRGLTITPGHVPLAHGAENVNPLRTEPL